MRIFPGAGSFGAECYGQTGRKYIASDTVRGEFGFFERMAAPLRILVTDPDQVARQLIMRSVQGWRPADFTFAGTAAEAKAALSAGERAFDLMFVDAQLPDDSGVRLTRWVRADHASPRPNLPVVLMSSAFPQDSIKAARHAGAHLVMQKPVNTSRVAQIVDEAASAYPNFIVSPAYVGPDRRVSKRPIKLDQRSQRSGDTQIVDDPSSYTLDKDAVVVVFDYLKLRLSRAEPEVFRDYLLRSHLRPAMHNIPLVRERVLARVSEKHSVLKVESDALVRGGGTGDTLRRMNGTALQIANDAGTAGFTLMAAISTSLHHYTSGAYEISDRLSRFLLTHVTALGSSIAHRIFDEGGNVGQSIIATIGVAEAVFRRSMIKAV